MLRTASRPPGRLTRPYNRRRLWGHNIPPSSLSRGMKSEFPMDSRSRHAESGSNTGLCEPRISIELHIQSNLLLYRRPSRTSNLRDSRLENRLRRLINKGIRIRRDYASRLFPSQRSSSTIRLPSEHHTSYSSHWKYLSGFHGRIASLASKLNCVP